MVFQKVSILPSLVFALQCTRARSCLMGRHTRSKCPLRDSLPSNCRLLGGVAHDGIYGGHFFAIFSLHRPCLLILNRRTSEGGKDSRLRLVVLSHPRITNDASCNFLLYNCLYLPSSPSLYPTKSRYAPYICHLLPTVTVIYD